MALSRREITKDVLQQTTEAAATTVGQVGAIVLSAFRDITRAVGDLGTEIFEIREAAARADEDLPTTPGGPPADRRDA